MIKILVHVITFYDLVGNTCWPYFKGSGEPGLMDRVLVLHAGSRGFESHRGTCLNDFSDLIDQDIRTQ